MASIQPIRGNPEQKQVWLNVGFAGGMNVTYADDMLQPTMMRNLVNYDLESVGELTTRKGFGKSNALTGLLYTNGVYHNANVNLTTQTEVFFTLLQNDNAAWHRLAETDDVGTIISQYGSNTKLRYLRLLVNANGSLYWEDVTVTISATPVRTLRGGTISLCVFNAKNNLLNFDYVDKYGRLYFTNNNKGMVIFDAEATVPTDPWTFVGEFTTTISVLGVPTVVSANEAYKPNAIEARKLGFNVLGDEPLSWLYESELTTETIQGVYLTTSDRKPIKVIPSGQPFQVNILYTGDVYVFTIDMSEYDSPISLTATKNNTYSTNGSLAVYDITLDTQPTDEVEIAIEFDSLSVDLDPYFDYYPTGPVPSDATIVDHLNVGEYKIMEMYDRLVYYKGNAIWFSEVDVYDYIPSYNYVLLPLDKTDSITRIVFFRSSYIVFTKRRIYKLEGDFESTTFNLALVNDNIGCIAGNTPMVIDNQMFFVSTQGLRALKTDTFKANLENVVEFDEAVRPLIYCNESVYALAYKDQYILMNNFRGDVLETVVNLRTYQIPDQMRFYYKQRAFVSDIFATNYYPKFIFLENGEQYSFRTDGVYMLGKSYYDFGHAYNGVLETTAFNFGYPTHEKKVKAIILKAGGGDYTQPIVLQMAADGGVVVSSELVPTGVDEQGNVTYTESNPDIGDSSPIDTQYGEGIVRHHTKKFRATARGKNIAIRVLTNFSSKFSVQGLGFVFKLGKVRE